MFDDHATKLMFMLKVLFIIHVVSRLNHSVSSHCIFFLM